MDVKFILKLYLFYLQYFTIWFEISFLRTHTYARMHVGQKLDFSLLVVPVEQRLLLCLKELRV